MTFPTCPVCNQPVDINTEAHITEQDGMVTHHVCSVPQVEPPVEPDPIPE